MPHHFRSILLSGLVSAMVAGLACSPPSAAKSDGGTDAGPTAQKIGGGCRQNSDCASQNCDTSLPGGACVATCSDAGPCPTGSTCASAPDGQSLCLASCSSDGDCRSGYVCDSAKGVCLPAPPPCHSNADCSPDQVCDSGTGLCHAGNRSPVGATCMQDSDCGSGNPSNCLLPSAGYTGGYCSGTCTMDADCGSGGTCVSGILTDANHHPLSVCMQSCMYRQDCRAGYNCELEGGQGFCFPYCRSDADCGGGYTCDTGSGKCLPPMNQPDGGMDGGTDGGMTSDYPAAFAAPPQVIQASNKVLSSPNVVGIFFANDDAMLVPQIEDFMKKLGPSQYWQAASEYGVGAISSVTSVQLTESATGTIDDSRQGSQLESWLASKISMSQVPQPDSNTVYVIYYPMGVTINDGGGQSCNDFGGYHSEMQLANGTNVAYAVIPRCPGDQYFSLMDYVTAATSHELIEATTDPYPDTWPAWSNVDDAHYYWDFANGGSELGDMCEQDPEAYLQFPDLPYTVQRFWSNQAVLAGHDPCVPDYPSEVFFNAVAELNDSVTVDDGFGDMVASKGVRIPVGQTKTITLDLYSDGPTSGPFNVQVQDFNQWYNGCDPTMTCTTAADLQITQDKTSGSNGDKINVTIKTVAAGQGNFDMFVITTSLGTGQDQIVHYWFGLVGEQ